MSTSGVWVRNSPPQLSSSCTQEPAQPRLPGGLKGHMEKKGQQTVKGTSGAPMLCDFEKYVSHRITSFCMRANRCIKNRNLSYRKSSASWSAWRKFLPWVHDLSLHNRLLIRWVPPFSPVKNGPVSPVITPWEHWGQKKRHKLAGRMRIWVGVTWGCRSHSA